MCDISMLFSKPRFTPFPGLSFLRTFYFMSIIFSLPWPPTANTYWRRKGNRYFISPDGIKFRYMTCAICQPYENYFNKDDRLKLHISAYPPDKRRRDLDNLLKSTQDALQYAKVYVDDSQIDHLTIKRQDIHKNQGYIIVDIEKIT